MAPQNDNRGHEVQTVQQPDAVVDVVMDECAKYIATQYGIAALFNPIDRNRIKAAILATMENE